MPRSRLILVDAAGTLALVVVTALASFATSGTTGALNLAVSGLLFLGGSAAFTAGFLVAVGRSRTEEIHLAGLFYLTGTAPRQVRRAVLGLWFVQIATATISVTTVSPPWGVMAPVWGIGLATLWSARHGRFPARGAQ
jgi:hypothetical protein